MGLTSSHLFVVPEKHGTQQRVGRIVSRENTVNLPGNVGREVEFSNVVFPGRIIIIVIIIMIILIFYDQEKTR